jgi:hypothetical protein
LYRQNGSQKLPGAPLALGKALPKDTTASTSASGLTHEYSIRIRSAKSQQ